MEKTVLVAGALGGGGRRDEREPLAVFEALRREREILRRASGFFARGVRPGRRALRLVHPASRHG